MVNGRAAKVSFRDKVAIVTGGASGIGAALSEELGARGAIVVIADFDEARAHIEAERLRGLGYRARGVLVDVRNASAMAALAGETAAECGSLDYMFNNAGILSVGEIRDLEPDHWRNIVDTNIFGVINGIHAAYPIMIGQQSGFIVNTASIAGLISSPLYAPYAASKAAVIAISAALRREAIAFGIRVSVICPGNVDTPIFDRSERVNVPRSAVFKDNPLGRVTPREAAKTIINSVSAGTEFIVFPRSARILWLAQRAAPNLLDALHREVLLRFRKERFS